MNPFNTYYVYQYDKKDIDNELANNLILFYQKEEYIIGQINY